MGNINTGQIVFLDHLVIFCLFLFFFKDFLVFILFASHEVQTTIEIGIKRTHYTQPRGWESQRVAYEPLHFK